MKKFAIYRNGLRFLSIYLGFSIISIAIILFLFSSSKSTLEEDIKIQTENDITSISNVFLEELSQLSTDIFLITDLINVHDSIIINNGSSEFTSGDSKAIIETEFLVWLGMKDAYDQIRFIDNTGQEIIRVNANNGSPYIVEDSELQNKASRYYFSEAIILDDRDLYMSVLDLNVENGEIEMIDDSPKPMLRLATPLFDKDGVKLGIVIVNYLAENLFETLDITEETLHSTIEIINESGYYLYTKDESLEFGFMYDNLLEEKFSKYHDYDVFSISSGEIVSEKYEDGYYTTIRLSSSELTDAANESGSSNINIVFGSKEFIIFTELNLNTNTAYKNMRTLYISLAIASLVVGLILTRLIDESIHLNRENIKRMKYDSLNDLLTTLPNRKSINEHIQNLLQRKKAFTLLSLTLMDSRM